MAEANQLPVLTLDFDDEQISRLQEIASEFRALRFTNPSGEAIVDPSPPARVSDNDERVDTDPRGGSQHDKDTLDEFRKFLERQNSSYRRSASNLRRFNTELTRTASALGQLFDTSVKWGATLGAVAVAGPLGYGALSARVSEQVRTAQGANVSPGTLQAANATYGTYFGDATSTLSQLASAQYDPSNPIYGGLMAIGLDPQANPADNYPELIDRISELVERYEDEGVALQYINSLGLGGVVSSATVNQIQANRDQLPAIREDYQAARERNDARLTAGVTTGYQAVTSSLSQNADSITDSFLNAISRLQVPITHLSDELTELITNFLDGPNGEAVFDSISAGLEKLASWLGSEQFQADMAAFGRDISAAVKGLRDFVAWLAKLFGQDPSELAAWGAGGAAAVGILGAGGVAGAVKSGGKIAGAATGATGALLRFSPLTAAPLALLPTNNTPTIAGEFSAPGVNPGVRPWYERELERIEQERKPVTETGFSANTPAGSSASSKAQNSLDLLPTGEPAISLPREYGTGIRPPAAAQGWEDYQPGQILDNQVAASTEPLSSIPDGNGVLTRGIRNNNPGNLRYAGQRGAQRGEDGFAVFGSRAEGLSALDRQIDLYLQRGKDTLTDIITAYAPPNENKTAEYIKYVERETGIDANQHIERSDLASVSRVIRAVINFENGKQGQAVSNREINNAIIERRGLPAVAPRDPLELKIVQDPGSDYRAQLQSQTGGN